MIHFFNKLIYLSVFFLGEIKKLTYSGDIKPTEVWEVLKKEKNCYLIDCRTSAEWDFVGIPDLDSIGKKTHLIEWQHYPTMEINVNFANEIKEISKEKDSKFIFICRSGGRSKSAAEYMTSQGFENCYNCLFGFEGGHDPNGQRGKESGWKFSKLPWKQG